MFRTQTENGCLQCTAWVAALLRSTVEHPKGQERKRPVTGAQTHKRLPRECRAINPLLRTRSLVRVLMLVLAPTYSPIYLVTEPDG